MRFNISPLPMVFEVQSDAQEDNRGRFQRLWCAEAFARARIAFTPTQSSLSTNHAVHTLRGMHWQAGENAEQKLVRCVVGAVWDVALDLRKDSPTYLRWFAKILSSEDGNALFLPRGVAHGYLTLTQGAVVEYLMDTPHRPMAARGARWNDPNFGINWPHPPAVMSERDREWPDYADD